MPGMNAAFAALFLALLVAGCTASSEASRSLSFDSGSKKAIVVIATSANRAQQEAVRSGRSLSSFWMEYNPDTQRLVPGGESFSTTVTAGALSGELAYLEPTVAVLEVEPGAYALVGAGFPHLMSTYVSSRPTALHNESVGRRQSWHFTVDPRVHIDPEAVVDSRRNYLFSVSPGEILYIGHFEFVKWGHTDSLNSINRSQDPAAAGAALATYPGISGLMITYDPKNPQQQVSR